MDAAAMLPDDQELRVGVDFGVSEPTVFVVARQARDSSTVLLVYPNQEAKERTERLVELLTRERGAPKPPPLPLSEQRYRAVHGGRGAGKSLAFAEYVKELAESGQLCGAALERVKEPLRASLPPWRGERWRRDRRRR